MDIPRAQHRYVQGRAMNNIHDVFEKTGVWVELPSADSESNSVTLRGNPINFGNALNMVWNKVMTTLKTS